jgi:hypothetical protein
MTDKAWKNVHVLDDDHDGDMDVNSIYRISRGEGRAPSRHFGEYRRSNRRTEDGYGELDFA